MKLDQIKPERWQRIEKIYHATLGRDASERTAFLAEACAGDESLRGEVESLLRCDARAENFIEAPALEVAAQLRAGERTQSMIGQQLGHYKILSLLGAGGMGEVYRARDTRLSREVAIKILPAAFANHADRLRRFEQEARAAGMLNHPNILVIYDIGRHQGAPYIVSELLEGETLREHTNGKALPVRKAIGYAQQIARGLAAAHEKGIVHRDLKPENLFITKDGRVKILDFGLAKLKPPQIGGAVDTEALTQKQLTDPGVVLGTVGYMSPEQVRGQEADHRADIFGFGAILYEMLTGKRAFEGTSAVETMNAILNEEPLELAGANRQIPPALERVMRHCLEKSPEERFQSARDLAFDLEMLSVPSGSGSTTAAETSARFKSRFRPALAIASLILVVGFTAYFIGKRTGTSSPTTYRQLTFRRGTIWSARFAPDGKTIVYSAAWNGKPNEIFSTRPESPESRSIGLTKASILSVSSAGEMAVLLNLSDLSKKTGRGTLARMPLVGGAPRELLEDVQDADWSPDGSKLAVVRYLAGRSKLECPPGKVLYETAGYISHPRISPNGNQIAFLDHPLQWVNNGSVVVADLAGNRRTLSGEWGSSLDGLAWSAGGDEVWFTASKLGETRTLYAVTLDGRVRVVVRAPISLLLLDVSRDGRVLLTRNSYLTDIVGLPAGEAKERDLSWLDDVGISDLSTDGKIFIYTHWGEGSGPNGTAYLSKTDGSPAVPLGEGFATALSPDGKWVLSTPAIPSSQILMLPTGAGEMKRLERDRIENYVWAGWFPDGKRILFVGREPGKGMRCYVQNAEGGQPRPVTPEGVLMKTIVMAFISSDGRYLIAADSQGRELLYSVKGMENPRSIPGLAEDDHVIRWSADGRSLFVYRLRELPAKVYRLDLSTGRKELWKELTPSDLTGIHWPIDIYPAILSLEI